jgi:hypothetical protein
MTTLEPFVAKSISNMQPRDWRIAQVKFCTSKLPPEDNIKISKFGNLSLYDKYIKSTKKNGELRKKVDALSTEIQSTKITMKATKFEKKGLKLKLVTLGKDP